MRERVEQALPPASSISSQPSFRDPAGCVLRVNGRVLRLVRPRAIPDLTAFLESNAAKRFLDAGSLPVTRVLSGSEAHDARELFPGAEGGSLILEHERIPFPSYPVEWPPEMLYEAAVLTLNFADALLSEGFGLKDATPSNILWRGPQPVLVDLASFERRDPNDATWLAFAQFQRTFLLPLMANAHFGMPLDQVFATRRDGLEPEDLYRCAGPLRRFLPPFLANVSIPVWLGRRKSTGDPDMYRPRSAGDPEKANYILRVLLSGARRKLERVKPKPRRESVWSDYAGAACQYTPEQSAAKEAFVHEALRALAPASVLDIGANTGNFSALAARAGASVVSVDADPVVTGAIWNRARAEGLSILPLAVNFARPTPATGWRNAEEDSFLDRACGAFDCVLMLAVVHHLLVTDRIPLPEILRLAARLTTGAVIVEFVSASDPMFRKLTRGREDLHLDATPEVFESCALREFTIERSLALPSSSRTLYLLRRRP